MYFQNYGLRKTWLDKCLKRAVLEHHSKFNKLKGPEICTTKLLSCFSLNRREIELEKVSLSEI